MSMKVSAWERGCPWKCQPCGYRGQKLVVTYHLYQRHMSLDEYPFTCKLCYFTAYQRTKPTKHGEWYLEQKMRVKKEPEPPVDTFLKLETMLPRWVWWWWCCPSRTHYSLGSYGKDRLAFRLRMVSSASRLRMVPQILCRFVVCDLCAACVHGPLFRPLFDIKFFVPCSKHSFGSLYPVLSRHPPSTMDTSLQEQRRSSSCWKSSSWESPRPPSRS